MAGKKGDLEVTVIEARNLGVEGQEIYCSIEFATQKNSSNAKVYNTTASKDCKWNQSFTLDLMSLENQELIVQLWWIRSEKKPKFLGMVQIQISVRDLAKGPEWYYLSDKPESERKPANAIKRSLSQKLVISGEIKLQLNYSPVHLRKSRSSSVPPPVNRSDEVRIDEALKEKQKIVKEKIEECQRFITTITAKIASGLLSPEEAAKQEGKLEAVRKNMSDLEKVLESLQAEQDSPRAYPAVISPRVELRSKAHPLRHSIESAPWNQYTSKHSDEEYSKLSDEAQGLRTKLGQLQGDYDALRDDFLQAQQEQQDTQAFRAKVLQLRTDYEALLGKFATIESENAESKREIEGLRAGLADKAKEIERQDNELRRYQGKIEKLDLLDQVLQQLDVIKVSQENHRKAETAREAKPPTPSYSLPATPTTSSPPPSPSLSFSLSPLSFSPLSPPRLRNTLLALFWLLFTSLFMRFSVSTSNTSYFVVVVLGIVGIAGAWWMNENKWNKNK